MKNHPTRPRGRSSSRTARPVEAATRSPRTARSLQDLLREGDELRKLVRKETASLFDVKDANIRIRLRG
jgi:hypothetical protein